MFGISTPTYGSPGIGASIRMLRADRASARLSASPSIRLSLTPGSTSRAYWVTTGPSWMRATFTPMPKWASVSRMRPPLAVRSIWAADDCRRVRQQLERPEAPRRVRRSRGPRRSWRSPPPRRGAPPPRRRSRRPCPVRRAPGPSPEAATRLAGGVRTGALPFDPVAGRSRRTITGGSSSASAPPARRSRIRSRMPGRGSARPAIAPPRGAGARRAGRASASCCRRSSRSARYAATRSPIVMLK